jgi:multicomponent Na+:H+ antiporter subunit G
MPVIDMISAVLIGIGAGFFMAGTVGMLRFPDVYTRLHVLAKADNLGLGFTMSGLLLQSDGAAEACKLILVWLMVLAASATLSFLIARRARRLGVLPWQETS